MEQQITNAETMDLLLVEDDRADVLLYTDAISSSNIKSQNIKVAVCHTLVEAEAALLLKKFDIILLDMNLPDSEELQGFKKLVNLYPDIPIVIHSSVYSAQLASEAIALGAEDYIVKGTMTNDDFVRTIIHAKIRHSVYVRLRNCLGQLR